jgi:hypothetical protein
MARKSSGGVRFIYSDPIERFSPKASVPSAPNMPPSKPPGSMVKDDGNGIAAPIPPITENPYQPNDDVLFGGAGEPPKPSDIRRPVNTTPATAAPAKPEIT